VKSFTNTPLFAEQRRLACGSGGRCARPGFRYPWECRLFQALTAPRLQPI